MKNNRLTFKIAGPMAALLLGLSAAVGGTASAADTANRSIVISEIKGTAYISHGGAKQIHAYKGMELRAGDRIISGTGGMTLSIPDAGDQITLGDNSELNVLLLNTANGHTATKLQLLRGTAYADVHDLRKSQDSFELSPSDRRLEVKGTHFYVGVDPVTGQSTIFVAAGTVNASPQGNTVSGGDSSTLLYPGQQLVSDFGSEPGNPGFSAIDIQQFIENSSPEIIEAFIHNLAEIQNENNEFLEQIQNQEELEKIQKNLNTLISDIVNQALDNNKISQSAVEKAIEEANRKISNPNQQIDLNHTSTLDPTKNPLDEASKKQQEAERKRKEQEELIKRQQQEELNKKMQELEKLNEMKKKLEEANQKAQEEKERKAKEDYEKQLSEAQKEQFKKDQDQRQQDREQMGSSKPASTQPPTSPGSGSSTGGSVSSTNPPVTPPVDPPVDPPVKPPTDPTEFNLDFLENPTGDRLIGENHLLDFKVRSEKLDPKMPIKIKVTYTPDREVSFDGIAYYYSYKDYLSMGNFLNRGVTLDAGGGTPFTLEELSENPVSLRTIWGEPATYSITVELIQTGETEKSLGTYTRSFNVVSGYPLINGIDGSDVEQLLQPPTGVDPANLRLQLSLRKHEDGGIAAAPGQHFKLFYHGRQVGNSETNSDGTLNLDYPADDEEQTQEGYKLVWLGAAFGEYELTGQWYVVNGVEGSEEKTEVEDPFRFHYSIKAPL
ncbi:hypothetical protein GRF59_20125 [Paenibacillus sp. HJL G12]|uniref:FecR protein domain-containing protein n=1 Tax=Paenibacillus dendrobii TaxID=2691084 RepID=A0A7X3ILX8_9BACL|nr:FecR domain-containing protein [Paenibacillus dendrobii]MWV45928.1 hypothetical protein [Paenibacillus dendrobii]